MEQLQTIATALALEGENPTAEQIVEAINGLNTQVTDLNTQITTATDSTENLSTVITALDELEPTIADAEDQQAKLNALEAYLDNLRNEDADAATTAQKEKDQIDANADPTDQFEHNKAADSFL